MNDIAKYKLLTASEEIALVSKAKKGDKKARELLITSNLRFVISVAKDYQGMGMPLEDLINEGNLGLIKAIARFDETRGFKLITYAVWWIKQAITQSLSEKGRTVRIPINRINDYTKLSRFANEFEFKHGRSPYIDEIKAHFNMSTQEVILAMSLANNESSIDDSIKNSNVNLANFIADKLFDSPDAAVNRESLSEVIDHTLESLNEREADIIRLYYGLNKERAHSLEDIGQIHDITRERVRQIKEIALSKLRHVSRRRVLLNHVN